MSHGLKPRQETDLQREKRLLRDGYDTRNIDEVQAQVHRRMEKASKGSELVERLREIMASHHGLQLQFPLRSLLQL